MEREKRERGRWWRGKGGEGERYILKKRVREKDRKQQREREK
jgi:hypothetical protein